MIPTKYFIAFVILFTMLLTWYTKTEIITEHEISNFYSTQLSYEQIEEMLQAQKKWEWLGYVFIVIFYFLKISLITLCVYIGAILSNLKDLGWKKIFRAVVIADLVFLIPAVIKMVWFTFQTSYTLEDVQYFLPGSMLNLFEAKNIETWLVYPIQSLNIWELAFFLLLALGLKKYLANDFNESLGLVFSTYGIGLLIWIVFITFISLNFS